MRKPNFFIVGAPKCGTTAMYEYLKQHPDVFMPVAKELHFFGRDLQFTVSRISEKVYLEQFASKKDERRVGEASVWYLFSKSAACEIKKFNPNSQIIIMLRNPVDMLYSNHSQFLFNGNEDVSDFYEALSLESERKKSRKASSSCHFIESLFYRETAKYTDQVKRYFDVFGRENVHVIIFDDFKNNTAEAYRKTLEFLGVDESFEPTFKVINANKMARSAWLKDFLQSPATLVRVVGKRLIPKPLRRPLINLLNDWNKKYVSRPPMNPDLRVQLIEEFCPEVEKLGMLLGKDLSRWCKE